MTDQDLVRRATQRATGDPFYLASTLAAYAAAEGLDDVGLAQAIGCAPADLPALRLCRCPIGDPAAFQADVRRIADHFRIDADRLGHVIRLAAALEVLRAPGADALLAAARDRDPEGGEES